MRTPAAASDDHATRLARHLIERGVLDRAWAASFIATPREHFLPAFYHRANEEWKLITAHTVGVERWRNLVYRDVTWVQRLDGPDHPAGSPACSSIQPTLAARMLTALPTSPGTRICEIGIGTGWLTALMCHRYGVDHVLGIDLDPALITQARSLLTALGYGPQLICADGFHGHPDRAPYDAIISTAAVTDLPGAWFAQIRPGGRIITPLRGAIAVIDVHDHDYATGRFLPDPVQILPLRTPRSHTAGDPATHSTTPHTAPAPVVSALRHPHFRFLLNLLHPAVTITDHGLLGDLTVTDSHGTSIRVPALRRPEPQHGTATLWALLHDTYQAWEQAQHPSPGNILLEFTATQGWARPITASTTRWRLR